MKRLALFIIASLLLCDNLRAQEVTRENVARECVLYEIFTGINCSNSPAVAAHQVMRMQSIKVIFCLSIIRLSIRQALLR